MAQRGVDQVCVVPITLCQRRFAPFVERLGGEPKHPAGHRDGHTVTGKVEDQRVHHFGLTSRDEVADSAAHHLGFLLEELDPFARFAQLRGLIVAAAGDPVRSTPSSRSAILSQRCRQASEIPKSFAIWRSGASPLRATAMTSARNSAGNAFGTRVDPSSKDESSQVRSQPNRGQSRSISLAQQLCGSSVSP